ncbi:MAG: ATP-binding protein [Alphaproteobacteria bacterium]
MSSPYDSTHVAAVGRRLMASVIGLLLVSALAVIGIIYTAAEATNAVSTERSVQRTEAALAMMVRSVERFAKDYSWWDDGHQRIAVDRNATFADDNIGWYAAQNLDMASAFVIGPDDRIVFAFVEGKPAAENPFEMFTPNFAQLVEDAHASPLDEPDPAGGFLKVDDQIHIVAVSPYTPEKTSSPWKVEARRSLLVFSRVLDDAFLARMSEDFLLKDLRIAKPGEALYQAAIPLRGPGGQVVGILTWVPDLPGASLMRRILPEIAAAFVVIAAVMLVVLRRAQLAQLKITEAARLLAEQNARLERSEKALIAAKDEAERANRSKAEFLAQLSHEIRTPMNAIVGFSELLGSEAYGPLGSPQYREYAEHIQTSAQHLLNLTNDVLDLSRAEIGRLDLAESGVDVGATIDFVVRMLTKDATAGGIVLTWKMPDGHLMLLADERRLRQMLINIVNNAIKFTPVGGTVSAAAVRRPDGGITVQVTDSGIGIAPADVEKALRPFTKLKADTTRSYEGAGIGLALTRQLVELHGGHIDLDSELGKGTIVSLLFPKERTIEVESSTAVSKKLPKGV